MFDEVIELIGSISIGDSHSDHPQWYDENNQWVGPKIWDLKNWALTDIDKFMEYCGPGAPYDGSKPCKAAEEYAASYGKAMDIEKARQERALKKKKADCAAKGKDYKWDDATHTCKKLITVTLKALTDPNNYYRYVTYCRGDKANTDLCKQAKLFWDEVNAQTESHLTEQKERLEKLKRDCEASGGKWQGTSCIKNGQATDYAEGGHQGASGAGWTWKELGVKPTPSMCAKYQAHDPDNPQQIIPFTYNTNVPDGEYCNELYGVTEPERAELVLYLGPKLDGFGTDAGAFVRFYKKYMKVDNSVYPFQVQIVTNKKVPKIVAENPVFKEKYLKPFIRYLRIGDELREGIPLSQVSVIQCHNSKENDAVCETAYKIVMDAIDKHVIELPNGTQIEQNADNTITVTDPPSSLYPDGTPPSYQVGPNVVQPPEWQSSGPAMVLPPVYAPSTPLGNKKDEKMDTTILYAGAGVLLLGVIGLVAYKSMRRQ